MANMLRCKNNQHFYDVDRFGENCPYCDQGAGVDTVGIDDSGNKIYTTPLTVAEDGSYGPTQPGDSPITKGYWDNIDIPILVEPVVGWLVCVAGRHLGADFRLTAMRNFIGRDKTMDVALIGDGSVSRDKHAVIVYEPRGNVFIVMPGEARQLFYLNGEVVLSQKEIKANDVLELGESKLMFIPCCSDKFNWESVKSNEKK